MKKFLFIIIISLVVAFPAFADHSFTHTLITQLQAQIAELQAKLNSLISQQSVTPQPVEVPPPEPIPGPGELYAYFFSKNLYFGLTNDQDVTELQKMLTRLGYYTGPITGNFFSQTQEAVRKFQVAKNISPASGYFGPLTRKMANELNVLSSPQSVTTSAIPLSSVSPPVSVPTESLRPVPVPASTADFNEVTLQINAGKSLGKLPDIFKSGGIWVAYDSTPYIMKTFLQESKMGPIWASEISQWGKAEFGNTSIKDFKQKLVDQYSSDFYVKWYLDKAKEKNEPVFISGWNWNIPRWLSSRTTCDKQEYYLINPKTGVENPNGFCIPGEDIQDLRFTDRSYLGRTSYPNNINAFKEMVRFKVRFVYEDSFVDPDLGTVNGLGIKNLGVFSGWEDEMFRFMSEKENFAFHKAVFEAAKEAVPGIKIAGNGPANIFVRNKICAWSNDADTVEYNGKTHKRHFSEYCKNVLKTSDDGGFVFENFIKFMAKNNIKLDFINFHEFAQNPILKFLPSWQKYRVNQWVEKYYGKNASKPKFYLAEWAVWGGGEGGICKNPPGFYQVKPGSSENDSTCAQNDTAMMAAAELPSLRAFFDDGYVERVGREFNNDSALEDREDLPVFRGGLGAFSRTGIKKPLYNAIEMISMLAGREDNATPERVNVSVSDGLIADSKQSTIQGVASKNNKGTVRVMLSNFVPINETILQSFSEISHEIIENFVDREQIEEIIVNIAKRCIGSNGLGEGLIESSLACTNKEINAISKIALRNKTYATVNIVTCISSEKVALDGFKFVDPISCLKYSKNLITTYTNNPSFADFIERYLNLVNSYVDFQQKPRTVNLKFSNLPLSGTALITTHTIDSNNSNACSWNFKNDPEKKFFCGGTRAPLQRYITNIQNDIYSLLQTELISEMQKRLLPQSAVSAVNNAFNTCRGKEQDGIWSFGRRTKCVREDKDVLAIESWYSTIITEIADVLVSNNVFLLYKNKLDEINNNTAISLEGSKKTEKIAINPNRNFEYTITIEPYASVLLEISDGSVANPSFVLSPVSGTVSIGDEVKFDAWYDFDGFGPMLPEKVTSSSFWFTDKPFIARIGKFPGEFAAGPNYGEVIITAHYNSLRASARVVVKAPGPSISMVVPTSGLVGANVTITGNGFTPTDNTVNFGSNVYPDQTSSDGKTIIFQIPEVTRPACLPSCRVPQTQITPGIYQVSVTNFNGTSNEMRFTVTSFSSGKPPVTCDPTAGLACP